jgi:hypothetical protein
VRFVDLALSGKDHDHGQHRPSKHGKGCFPHWMRTRNYEADADIGSYKTDAALRTIPFQNLYSMIANDLGWAVRGTSLPNCAGCRPEFARTHWRSSAIW